MALTTPRDMTTGRRWSAARITPMLRQEFSRAASGLLIAADLGPMLWRGDFRSFPLRRDAADALLADFQSLGGARLPFLAHPAERPRPASSPDPAGPALAGVTVRAVRADRTGMQFAGLPANFALSAGDWVSIQTAAGREVVRLARAINANGFGDTATVDLAQPLRPAVAVGQAVTLADPLIEMRLAPETLALDPVGLAWHALVFSCVQVVR